MSPSFWYYTGATLLAVTSAGAWLTNLFMIPGNWIIVLAAAVFAWLVPAPGGGGLHGSTVAVLLGLAMVGEIIEFAAGAAGAAKSGGSRRGMVLALVGAMAGSVAGALIGVPIPLAGPILGAVGGGALGAFAGAWAGEYWKGRTGEERLAIGRAALIGRLLGTAGKLATGAVMVAIVVLDAFVELQ